MILRTGGGAPVAAFRLGPQLREVTRLDRSRLATVTVVPGTVGYAVPPSSSVACPAISPASTAPGYPAQPAHQSPVLVPPPSYTPGPPVTSGCVAGSKPPTASRVGWPHLGAGRKILGRPDQGHLGGRFPRRRVAGRAGSWRSSPLFDRARDDGQVLLAEPVVHGLLPFVGQAGEDWEPAVTGCL
jgi:hypothetical protein